MGKYEMQSNMDLHELVISKPELPLNIIYSLLNRHYTHRVMRQQKYVALGHKPEFNVS